MGLSVHLPSFIIGGAPRAGTTSIASWLNSHPEIYIPQKEPNFYAFSTNERIYKKLQGRSLSGPDEYQRLYTFPGAEVPRVTGEKSVSYLYGPWSSRIARAIIQHNPKGNKLKMIFILRDPVERMYSQYVYNTAFDEKLGFVKAVETWPERQEEGWVPAYDYIGGSMYAQGIRNFKALFPDMRVFLFDDLVHDPVGAMESILSFIGLPNTDASALTGETLNASGMPRTGSMGRLFRALRNSGIHKTFGRALPPELKQAIENKVRKKYMHKPPLDAGSRKRFAGIFEEDIEELEKITGYDLTHWKTRGK